MQLRRVAALLFVAVFSLFCGVCQAGVNVAFLEGQSGQFLQTGSHVETVLDQSALVSAATALLNLETLTDVDAQHSKQINQIVKASPFSSADALLLLTVAGAEQGDLVQNLDVQATGDDDLLTGLALLKQADSAAEQIQLDTCNMAGCGEVCLEQHLKQAIQDLRLNGSYSETKAPLKGAWKLIASPSLETTLNLEETSDRLFALEVASYWAAVRGTVVQMQSRSFQNPGARSMPQILSRAFISLHMIKQTHGSSSQQYLVATNVFRTMLATSIEVFQAGFEGRLVTAIVSLDNVNEAQENGLWALTAPSSPLSISRRKLLASASNDDYLNNFIAWIAMWSTFFLLLFFALTGCHCLKSMKFKQDSLLYGKNKSD